MELPVPDLSGNGLVSAKTNKIPVKYELWMRHNEILAGSVENSTATIDGLQKVEGWVFPVCGSPGERLTLEMNDGLKVRFYFRDREGSIADGVLSSDFP